MRSKLSFGVEPVFYVVAVTSLSLLVQFVGPRTNFFFQHKV